MDARRFLWILVIVALATMLTMLVVQKTFKAPQAERAAETAGENTPAIQPPAATAPATTRTQPAPERPQPAPATTQDVTAPATSTAPAGPAPAIPAWSLPLLPVKEVLLGSLDQRTGYKFQVQLTTKGAAVKTLKLSEHFTTVEDKRRWKKDPDTYEQAVKEDPNLHGNYSLLNPVSFEGAEHLPMATRRVSFPDEPVPAQVLDLSDSRWEVGEVTTDDDGTQRVDFTALIRRNGAEHVRLIKTYTLRKGSHSVEVGLRAENLSGGKLNLRLTQFTATGVPREDVQSDQRYVAYGKIIDTKIQVPKVLLAKTKNQKPGLAGAQDLGRSDAPQPAIWAGVANKFFASLTYVKPEQAGEIAAPSAEADYQAAVIPETVQSRTFLTFVGLGPYELAAGGSHQVEMDVFAGAMDRAMFTQTPLYKELDYEASLNFGECWCVVTPIVLGLMWLLETLGGLLHNYGLAIIVLVAAVRLVLHPLTKKGQVSMMAMQKLQPEMEKLKQQYANDKQKLQAETMKLYKSAGFTPMLGCLPMVLQMPIWFALWRGLQATVALRHEAFLPVWITDLAAPDALIKFAPLMGGYSFPMVGQITSFNLLPILLGVAMFFQQKFSPQAAAATSEKQATQKQMMYFMTVFFLLIFYNMPSGLNLYIMTSTFAGVAEQYFIRKHIRERQAAEAAVETKVSIPGKHFRGQKPKKPKPPFKV